MADEHVVITNCKRRRKDNSVGEKKSRVSLRRVVREFLLLGEENG